MGWLEDTKESISYGINTWLEIFWKAPNKQKLMLMGLGFLASLSQFFEQGLTKVDLKGLSEKYSASQITTFKLFILAIGIPLVVIGTVFFLAYIQTILNRGYRKGVLTQHAKKGLVLGVIFAVLVMLSNLDSYVDIVVNSGTTQGLLILLLLSVFSIMLSIVIVGPLQLFLTNIVILENLGIAESFKDLINLIIKKPIYFIGHYVLNVVLLIAYVLLLIPFVIIGGISAIILFLVLQPLFLGLPLLRIPVLVFFLLFIIAIFSIYALGILMPIKTAIWLKYVQLWHERVKG